MPTQTESSRPIPPPAKLEPGVWEGEYIDVRGVHGTLRLDLDTVDAGFEGSYELRLRLRDQPKVYSGRLRGTLSEGKVQFEVALPQYEKRPGSPETLKYDAELRDGGSYARQTMYGTVRSSPESLAGGGVWIAWRFGQTR